MALCVIKNFGTFMIACSCFMKHMLEIPFIVAPFECLLICQRKGMLKHSVVKMSGGVDVKLHEYFTSAPSNGECQFYAPSALVLNASHEAEGLLLDVMPSELQ
jgi:hypothetical protein